ncbi:MAG: tetratricopeptide repeat protein [Pseudomonadota bacterium]
MSNVVDFPYTSNKRLREALKLFDKSTAGLALAELNKLIDQGCDEAWSYAGNLYMVGGNGIDRDYVKARYYYEQSVQRIGSVAAYLGLIRIYYYGLGIDRDYEKAFEYCLLLSKSDNNPYANFYIGRMYMDGDGIEKDIETAKEYFRKAWSRDYVFGLTYLGLAEQQSGHWLRGFWYRMKAALITYGIASKNIKDPRIREF